MIAYVDTSVILRILFREPNPVEVWGQWERAFSSSLWRVEALRTVDRVRLSGDLSDRELADLIERHPCCARNSGNPSAQRKDSTARQRDLPNHRGNSGCDSFSHRSRDTGSRSDRPVVNPRCPARHCRSKRGIFSSWSGLS